MDELLLNVRHRTEYRDACVICLTETWLTGDIPTDTLTLPGFHGPYRADRDLGVTGKTTGGGVCLYVNECWCPQSAVTVREIKCTKDVEILSMSLRPYYLPR